jgi:hypothetical protein
MVITFSHNHKGMMVCASERTGFLIYLSENPIPDHSILQYSNFRSTYMGSKKDRYMHRCQI